MPAAGGGGGGGGGGEAAAAEEEKKEEKKEEEEEEDDVSCFAFLPYFKAHPAVGIIVALQLGWRPEGLHSCASTRPCCLLLCD